MTITSAADHLNQILQDIVADGTPMPDLQVVSPSTRQPLEFVYVSLSGPLKENPRPDILEEVRVRLDAVDGLEARWMVSSGRSDKTCQAYFEVEESLNPLLVFKSPVRSGFSAQFWVTRTETGCLIW